MSSKPGNKPIPWTPEQDQALRDIWPTGKRINSHRDLFGEHTYGAIMARASNLGLGRRAKCARGQSPIAWPLIEKELEGQSASVRNLAIALSLNEKTVHRLIAQAHASQKVHIAEWERRTKSAKATPVYGLGAGVDAEKPQPMTSAEKNRRCLAAKRQKRAAAGLPVRGINPFATAAGAVIAPSPGGGRVVKNLHDDEREAA